MKRLIPLLIAVCLSACATAQTLPTSDALKSHPILTFTENDFANAAQIATTNGYPARAAFWTAKLAELKAIQGQVDACEAAIAAALPKPPSVAGTVGAAAILELGVETVGQGIPASVKINCMPIILPTP